MLPHEATHRAISGHRKAVAVRLSVSTSTVEKHCLPPCSLGGNGMPSPAQAVIETHHALRVVGEEAKATELVSYIASECGGVFVPLPGETDPRSLDDIGKATKEFGELLLVTAIAQSDGVLTASDSEQIVREGNEAIVAIAGLVRAHHAVVVEEEFLRERQRRGPHRAMPRLHQLRMAMHGRTA